MFLCKNPTAGTPCPCRNLNPMPRTDRSQSLRNQATDVEDARERKTTHHFDGGCYKITPLMALMWRSSGTKSHGRRFISGALPRLVIFSNTCPGYEIVLFVQAFENLHLVSYRPPSLTLSIFMFVRAIDRSGTLNTDGGDFLSTSSDHVGMISCWQYG
jgi:hypothetical protein